MCDCEDNRPEFYQEDERVARKQHRCCECGIFILPGQRYWACTGKWDAGVETMHQCRSCYDLMHDYQRETGECVCFTQLRETLVEFNCH